MTARYRLPGLLLLALATRVPAQDLKPDASRSVVTFDADKVGAPSGAFEPVIGDWYVGTMDNRQGLIVDGMRWQQGTPSANLADQAKRLYGDRYAEFLDGVKAFAFFPLTVWSGDCAAARELSVRFYPIAGKIDQAAGIAYDIGKDGSYSGVRANALENNLLFFKVVRGKRTILENIRGVETPSRTWHELQLKISGTELSVSLDGTERLHRKLERAPAGRCGLWSKADSKVLFDDFSVSR